MLKFYKLAHYILTSGGIYVRAVETPFYFSSLGETSSYFMSFYWLFFTPKPFGCILVFMNLLMDHWQQWAAELRDKVWPQGIQNRGCLWPSHSVSCWNTSCLALHWLQRGCWKMQKTPVSVNRSLYAINTYLFLQNVSQLSWLYFVNGTGSSSDWTFFVS